MSFDFENLADKHANKALVLSLFLMLVVFVSANYVSASSSDVSLDNANMEIDHAVIDIPADVNANVHNDVNKLPITVGSGCDVRPPMEFVHI